MNELNYFWSLMRKLAIILDRHSDVDSSQLYSKWPEEKHVFLGCGAQICDQGKLHLTISSRVI